jgi:hypothetical protein
MATISLPFARTLVTVRSLDSRLDRPSDVPVDHVFIAHVRMQDSKPVVVDEHPIVTAGFGGCGEARYSWRLAPSGADVHVPRQQKLSPRRATLLPRTVRGR